MQDAHGIVPLSTEGAVSLANVVAGILLWRSLAFGYTLVPRQLHILLVPVVVLTGFALCLLTPILFRVPRAHKKILWGVYLPLLLAGVAYAGLGLLSFVLNPLGTVFWWGEVENEHLVYRAVSPGGERIADVYVRDTGGYTGAIERVIVRVGWRLIPFIERDVYHNDWVGTETPVTVSWRGDTTVTLTIGSASSTQVIRV